MPKEHLLLDVQTYYYIFCANAICRYVSNGSGGGGEDVYKNNVLFFRKPEHNNILECFKQLFKFPLPPCVLLLDVGNNNITAEGFAQRHRACYFAFFRNCVDKKEWHAHKEHFFCC